MAGRNEKYEAKDYSGLRGLHGITDEQIEVHLELYEGYVKRTNKLLETLSGLAKEAKFDNAHFQELKRRLGWEFNGMRLHELYFDVLKPGGSGVLTPDHDLGALAKKQFGSINAWKADLMGVAKLPGVGWAVTYVDPGQGTPSKKEARLINVWVEQHDAGHLATCRPVLVLDVWEHAFGVYLKPNERERYLEDFFANVDWTAAGRF